MHYCTTDLVEALLDRYSAAVLEVSEMVVVDCDMQSDWVAVHTDLEVLGGIGSMVTMAH